MTDNPNLKHKLLELETFYTETFITYILLVPRTLRCVFANKRLKLPNDHSGWETKVAATARCALPTPCFSTALRKRLHLLSRSLLVMCQQDVLLSRAGATGQRAEGGIGEDLGACQRR